MSRKTLCYEDYFRISNTAADQNASIPNTEPGSENLRKAATILIHNAIHFIKGNQNSTANVMSGQRGQGPPYSERSQNEQFQHGGPHFDGRRHMMGGEPERLRPLETCESYEQSSWNQPEYRRQVFEQGMHYEQADYSRYERNIFRSPSHFEMQYEHARHPEDTDYEFDRQSGYDDNQTYHDRQQFNNRQPLDRQFQFERQREFHSDKYQSVGNQFISGSQVSIDEQQNTPAPGSDKGDRKEVEEDKEEEENTSYCSVCKMHFDNAQKYFIHIRGMLHTQRQIAAESDGGKGVKEVKEDNQQRPQQHSEHQEPGTHQQENQTDQGGNMQEENTDDDEDTSFCKLCSVHFDTPQKYFLHTRGMLHTQRQLEASKGKFGVTEEEVQRQKQLQKEWKPEHFGKPRSVASSTLKDDSEDKEDNEQYEEDWEEWEVEENKPSNLFTCELCDIQTTGIQALRAHENGRNHKLVQEAVENGTTVPQRIYCRLGPKAQIPDSAKPITAVILNMKPASGPSVLLSVLKNIPEAVVGSEFVKEGRSGKQPTFLCTVCESTCDTAGIISHLIGSKHRMKYLRAHQPTVYEHVRNHGGKKSELSAFLEQVCSDVEKKEGRKKPIMDKPDGGADQEKNEADKDEPTKTEEDKEASEDQKEEKKEEEEKKKDQEMPSKKEKRTDKQSHHPRRYLPHDVVMAMYKEGRNREDHYEAEEGPFGGRGFGDHPRELFRFGFGRGGVAPDFGPPQMGRSSYFPFPGRPEPYPPPFMDYPIPFIVSEEERLNRMYDYEKYLFDHPMLFCTPEEARHRMFDEYERLGIPYDIACDRVMLQEERRVRIMNYMKEGLSLQDAQTRLRKFENRKRLIREYELQGLDTREARWRAVVEEERENLYEKYEKLGFSPLEARAKIMAGEDRMHLIQEFERHGMTPEEAQRRAVHEEDRLKDFEASSAREQSLDDIADRRMLETYLEQGDTREQADNKVIAVLRRQGVPTQEAILRVQKIVVKVAEKREKGSPQRKYDDHIKVYERAWSPTSHDYKNGSDRESSPRSHNDQKKGQNQEGTSGSRQIENFDNITPEEAKERLFQEYEKRGVPREKARLALIQELIRSGVPEEEAKRRFRDTRLVESTSREEKEKRKKHSRYERSRSRSSSSSGSSYKRKRSSPIDWKRSSKLHRNDRIRANVQDDRYGYDKYPHSEGRKRENKFPFRRERDYDRGLRGSKDEERYSEYNSLL